MDKKLYVWDNDSNTDFNTGDLCSMYDDYSSGSHSGGYVVVAESLDKAVGVVMANNQRGDYKGDTKTDEEIKEYLKLTVEVKTDGLVYYGNGDC